MNQSQIQRIFRQQLKCGYQPFSSKILIFKHQQQTAFENIVGKGEIACNKQFLPFLQCFLHKQIIESPFVYTFDIISLLEAVLEEPKMGISGKGLKDFKI